MTISSTRGDRHPSILDRFVAPFRTTSRTLLDPRTLSDHFMRDIGLLDGHRTSRGSRSI